LGKEPLNYFNYFTEIEEHFQKSRGTGLFLLSPLDWALIETWKDSGVPLEAVLKGIERTFEKWHARKHKTRMVNSLAFCAQEVLEAARSAEESTPPRASPGFAPGEITAYLLRNAGQLRQAAGPGQGIYLETAESLERLAAADHTDLEELERRLTVLEERMIAAAVESTTEEQLLEHRRQMDRHLAPYRRKMTADQLAMLEKQYLQRLVLERTGLPRLSLFYL
jgi:hypothetical protein